MVRNVAVVFGLLLVAHPGLMQAQGQFGRAVAVGASGEVFVLKPASGKGPAAVYVFSADAAGAWTASQELYGVNGVDNGHGLSPSIATMGGSLLVGSGDPQVAYAAHVFRGDGGGWMTDGRIMLDPGAAPAPPTQLDLAGLMRIMQPAQRLLAADGEVVVTGVVGGLPSANGVRVFRRSGAGWTGGERLSVPGVGGDAQFGAAVAVRGDVIAVGAPRHGLAGAVFVFGLNGNGWALSDSLVPTDVPPQGGFGSAVTFHGDAILGSAPGVQSAPGLVIRFTPAGGEWFETDRLTGTSGPGSRFGAAMAVSEDGLFVGAPLANGRRGMVFQYDRLGGAWADERPVGSGLAEPGALYGMAVAAGSGLVVAGAPGAAGGDGRAVVHVRDGSTWSEPIVLDPGGNLESVLGREVLCEDGKAAGFDCSNVDLLAFLPIESLGGEPGEGVSDIWGWTDPESGREFALVGRTGGAVFVDITDPTSPVRIGELPANPSGARDLKVYNDHLFFTGDGAGQHGLIVFNLARLRDVTDPPEQFEADAVYTGIASAHNLIMDTENGFAFPVGASAGGETCGGGLHMVDVRDPLNPTFAGCYTDTEGLIWAGRTHDGQCVAYRGPDEQFAGRQLCFASNETALRIVDVTDKENPAPISAASYPGIAYAHQGWLTDDHRYFYLNDELDELVGTTERTRTLVWDIAELDDPVLIGEFLGPNGSTDHNLYVRGNRMYQANYQAGLRVIDISDPQQPVEIGYFDTTPYVGDPPGFVGAWTAYPFFESGTVIVSSMNEGLFILRPRPATLIP